MAEKKHTPGPWRVTQHTDGTYVRAANGYAMAQLYCPDLDDPNWKSMMQANAQLIAAAPQLLSACKLALEILDRMGMDWLGKDRDPLEAAIARAEGRE